MRALGLVLLVCGVALAGCADGEAADEAVADLPQLGDLEGHVADEAGRALAGVALSLLGTDAFGSTGPDGAFHLADVPAGVATLQAIAEGFEPNAQEVEILAGNTTTVNITLAPDVRLGGGDRAHVHDDWAEQDRITLMDEAISLTAPEPGAWYLGPHVEAAQWMTTRANTASERLIPWADREGGTRVLPGTASLEITLDWDLEDTPAAEMRLTYRTAAPGKPVDLGTVTPGETLAIPVLPGESDSGHQAFTSWRFWVSSPTTFTDGADHRPNTNLGDLDVKIEIIKGDDVPLEPAHVDPWGGAQQLHLTPDPLALQYRSEAVTTRRPFLLDEGYVVSPGTTSLRMAFTYATAGTESMKEYALAWRSADMNPQQTGLDDLLTADATDGPAAGTLVYEVTLEAYQTDAIYQQTSNWAWYPIVVGGDPTDGDWGVFARDFTLDITAYR